MFALIETKGATHIAIHVPQHGAEKSLPALVAMLENNATFIHKSWREINTVTPEMTVILGDRWRNSSDDCADLVVKADDSVIDDSFVIFTPGVLVSNREVIAKKDAEIKRLQTELNGTKAMLEQANAQVRALTEAAQQ